MSTSLFEIDELNRQLVNHYGKDVHSDKARLRIVWSTKQYEWKVNEAGFDIFDETGTIFLRTEFGPHEVEKYPLYPDKWVLEVLVPNTSTEIVGVTYSYEPLWIFGAANSNPDPIWRAVKLLVDSKLAHHRSLTEEKKNEKDHLAEEEAAKKKEAARDLDRIREDSEPLVLDMVNGSAVTVPAKPPVDNTVVIEKVGQNAD